MQPGQSESAKRDCKERERERESDRVRRNKLTLGCHFTYPFFPLPSMGLWIHCFFWQRWMNATGDMLAKTGLSLSKQLQKQTKAKERAPNKKRKTPYIYIYICKKTYIYIYTCMYVYIYRCGKTMFFLCTLNLPGKSKAICHDWDLSTSSLEV